MDDFEFQDEPNTLKVSGTYELPIGPGKKYVNNYKLGNLVGGWQVGWILDYEAGTPISGCSNSSVCENGSPFPNGFNRPDRNSSESQHRFLQQSARLLRQEDTRRADVPRSRFHAHANPVCDRQCDEELPVSSENPPTYLESLNAKKHFYIGERVTATLSVDYFNAFNRTRFQRT